MPVTLPDRTGMMWSADPPGTAVLRVGLVPFADRVLVVWGVGPTREVAALEATVTGTLGAVGFPDGGLPAPTLGARLGYALRHFGLAIGGVLGVLGAGVALVLRRLMPRRGWEAMAD